MYRRLSSSRTNRDARACSSSSNHCRNASTQDTDPSRVNPHRWMRSSSNCIVGPEGETKVSQGTNKTRCLPLVSTSTLMPYSLAAGQRNLVLANQQLSHLPV